MAEVPAPELHVTLAAPRKKRRPWVRALQVLISIAVVVAVFFYAIPKFADYGKVWDTIKSLSLLEVLILVAVTAFNVFTYWPQMTASFPGLTIAQADQSGHDERGGSPPLQDEDDDDHDG